jgi:hypothetical protein
MITIRRCQTADVPDVLAFLQAHWKPGHIFTRDRELFDWQYARPDRPGEYAIALARTNDSGELVGMLGYLPTRRFDPALAGHNAIWLALWRVREDISAGPIGLQLLNDVTAGEPHTSIGVIGFQPIAAAIYTALKFQVGELRHYVLLNPDASALELASFQRRPDRNVPDTNLTAVAVDDTTFSATVAGSTSDRALNSCPIKQRRIFGRGIFSIPGIDMTRSCCAATLDRSACWPPDSPPMANGGPSASWTSSARMTWCRRSAA